MSGHLLPPSMHLSTKLESGINWALNPGTLIMGYRYPQEASKCLQSSQHFKIYCPFTVVTSLSLEFSTYKPETLWPLKYQLFHPSPWKLLFFSVCECDNSYLVGHISVITHVYPFVTWLNFTEHDFIKCYPSCSTCVIISFFKKRIYLVI